jgi:hypothetical protein
MGRLPAICRHMETGASRTKHDRFSPERGSDTNERLMLAKSWLARAQNISLDYSPVRQHLRMLQIWFQRNSQEFSRIGLEYICPVTITLHQIKEMPIR